MKLSRLLIVIPFAANNFAVAATFDSVDSYLATITGVGPSNTATAQSNDRVIGVVQWVCPGACDSRYVASVFVLDRNIDGSLVEFARSKAFEWQESAKTPALESVEIENGKFFVTLHHFAPTGQTRFTFVYRGNEWLLAGSDTHFLSMIPDHGDEAVGDTIDKRSVNFLTGEIVEAHYRANAWHSERMCSTAILRVTLEDVDLFDDRLITYCQ